MQILVVDDEALARARLLKLIERMDGFDVCGEAEHGKAAIAAVESLDPELVLMDIKMPGMDGLDAARAISQMEDPPAIIFCTAYDNFALEAFGVQAAGYLVKPVTEEQLKQALEKASRVNKLQRAKLDERAAAPASQRKHLTAKTHKGIELIPIENIHCFIADLKYVTVFHKNGESIIDETLKELEQELAPGFLRVHRNALVAVKCIEGLARTSGGVYEIVLKGSTCRPMISRRHLGHVKTLINEL